MIFLKKQKSYDRKLLSVPVDDICPNPSQARVNFDMYELSKLSESIIENGILQPLSVRLRPDGRYELIAGERRLRAAKMAGLKEVSCITTEADDESAAVLSLIENIQRKNLSMFEEAEGISYLLGSCGITQTQISHRLGMAQSTLANKLRLLKLNTEQRKRIISAMLTERHARAVVRLEDDAMRDEALDIIIARGLQVAESEALIEEMLKPQKKKKKTVRIYGMSDIRLFSNSLTRIVETVRRSGYDAKTEKNETESFVEFVVRIPKNTKEEALIQKLPL